MEKIAGKAMGETVTDALKWWQELYQQIGHNLPKVAVAVVVFLVALLIAHIIASGIRRRGCRHAKNQEVYGLLAKFTRFSILMLGLVSALGTMGISVSALVASLGVAGLAASLALKDILTSTLAGVFLMIHHPYRVKDFIAVKAVEGKVLEISLRFTVLENEGKRIMVPNSVMLVEAVTVTPAVD
jgi:small conductance mechanosensitive channel